MRPARDRLRELLTDTGIRVAGDLEAGLLPNTVRLVRSPGPTQTRPESTSDTRPPRFVTVVFADAETGADPETFAEALATGYQMLDHEDGRSAVRNASTDPNRTTETGSTGRDGGTVVKGHSVQVEGGDTVEIWGERFRPIGERRPGYRAVNIDVIHAFPDLSPHQQAAVAVRHTLNDCYAQGATNERVVRPIVAPSAGSDVLPDRVRRWFRIGVPKEITLVEPAIVEHDGRGWLFGATATATTDRTPPVRRQGIEPGDRVLLHRPLGALALYTGGVDTDEPDMRSRALEALQADHVCIAAVIASCCPGPDEAFDPARHLKWVGDISGSGVYGLVHTAAAAGCGLHVEELPVIDTAAVAAVRERWTMPDVTVETNGPLAAIGTPVAIERLRRRLRDVPVADPVRIGRTTTTAGALSWDEDVALERYIEHAARESLTVPRDDPPI